MSNARGDGVEQLSERTMFKCFRRNAQVSHFYHLYVFCCLLINFFLQENVSFCKRRIVIFNFFLQFIELINILLVPIFCIHIVSEISGNLGSQIEWLRLFNMFNPTQSRKPHSQASYSEKISQRTFYEVLGLQITQQQKLTKKR